MPGDPKECREHAQHWLKLANSAPTLIAKMRFVRVGPHLAATCQ